MSSNLRETIENKKKLLRLFETSNKVRQLQVEKFESFLDSQFSNPLFESTPNDNEKELEQMSMRPNKTLKELVVPTLDQKPLCIEYPPLKVPFELKLSMIHLLPIFQDFAGENLNKHLKEFSVVFSSMNP